MFIDCFLGDALFLVYLFSNFKNYKKPWEFWKGLINWDNNNNRRQ